MSSHWIDPGSFRDPSGFVYSRQGGLYRQVNLRYREDYDLLMGSGLHQKLLDKGLVIPHQEVEVDSVHPGSCYRVIQPELVPFVSYPYEWSFGQLKAAALATLTIQKIALDYGMSLKDASAYNVQFLRGKPVLIDTLSFEKYRPGQPWVAYRQYCQHFLAALALMCYADGRLSRLAQLHLDGIPLDLAATILPARAWFSPSLLVHIKLHSRSIRVNSGRSSAVPTRTMKKGALLGLIESLTATTHRLKWHQDATTWGDYYAHTNYSRQSMASKTGLVREFLKLAAPHTVWDLGANDGRFSRLAAEQGAFTVAYDFDPVAVEKNYQSCLADGITGVLPLQIDLANPTPGVGWENRERQSLVRRGPADLIMALALVHHLAIGNNLPLPRIAEFLASLGHWLIIEFVPREDSQIHQMLATREDIFDSYTRPEFEQAFASHYHFRQVAEIADSQRTLYLMEGK